MTTTALESDNLVLSPDAQDLLFREARTANTFTEEPVTQEQIRAIYDLVRYAPTSANTQPMRLVLVASPEARARLLPHMSEGNRAKTQAAPLVAIVAADSNFHEHLPTLFPIKPEMQQAYAGKNREPMRLDQARFNTALQAGYLILGIRAAGLAAGPMGGFDAAGIDAEFFADGRYRTQLVINIGKPGPGAWMDRLPRLSYDDVATWL